MFRPILVILSVTAVSLGYDFSDPAFNEVVMNNWLEFSDITGEPQLHYRERRETDVEHEEKCKPHRFFKKVCCDDEIMNETVHAKTKEVAKECFQEIRQKLKDKNVEHHGIAEFLTCDGLKRGKNELSCAMTCIGQKQGVLDADGNLIKEKIKEKMTTECLKPEWAKKSAETFVDKCVDDVNKALAAEPKVEGDCNKAGIKFAFCVFKEISVACPADKQKKTDKCNKLRDRISKGEDIIQIKDFTEEH